MFAKSLACLVVAASVTAAIPFTAGAQGVTFAVGTYTGQPGETVSALVRVSGFAQVTTAQFTLQWDPGVLQFVSTGAYGLTGLGGGNMGAVTTVVSGTTVTRGLTFSWDDPDGLGVTVPDGTTIFSVAFRVVGFEGSRSLLSFENSPTLQEATVNFEVVNFIAVGGQVTVPAVAQSIISVSPASAAFGDLPVGAMAERTLHVSNTGAGVLSGTAAVAAPFSVVSGASYSLAASQSQAVVVRYNPVTPGRDVATLTFTGGGGASASLTGSAYSPVIAVAPFSQSFGEIPVGTSEDRSFHISNAGGGTLSGTASVAAPFSVISGGSYSLAAGQIQVLVVRYSPTTAGTDVANLSFTGGAGVSASLSGSAYSPPVLGLSPVSQSFGDIPIGTTVERTFQISNNGGGTLTGVASVAAPFTIVSGGAYSLTANQNQAVVVRYSPLIGGSHAANLTFTGGGGISAALTGSSYPPPVLFVTPLSQAFGDIPVGATVERSYYVTNTGGGRLNGITMVRAPFRVISGDSYSLAANEGQEVVVQYSPTTPGDHQANLTFAGDGWVVALVAGSAHNPPILSLTPLSQVFGDIRVGSTAERTFYITNTGGGTLSGTALVAAPFSIVAGGSYSLSANQGQAVVVEYNPATAGPHVAQLIFSGAAGARVEVSGSAQLNAGTFSFTSGEYRIREDGTFDWPVTVTREGGTGGAVSVFVTPSEITGGATAGEDFEANLIELRFEEGDLRREVTIVALADDLLEGDETLKLSLSLSPDSPSAAAVGAVSEAIVVMENNSLRGPQARLEWVSSPTTARSRVCITGTPGQKFELQATSDLLQWTTVASGILSSGPSEVIHPLTDQTTRLFRAVLVK